MNKRTGLILLLALLTASCDCVQRVKGRVFDTNSKQALAKVYVQKENRAAYDYSNEDGRFEVHSISGGLFSCPPMTIVLSKEGYQTLTIKSDADTLQMIYMKKVGVYD